jgi:hypothetical protein
MTWLVIQTAKILNTVAIFFALCISADISRNDEANVEIERKREEL